MQIKNIIKLVLSFPRFKRKAVAVPTAFFIVVLSFFAGIDDRCAAQLYLQKLQSLSEYQIDNTQKYLVTDFYLHNKNRRPSSSRRHKTRAQFNSRKHKLKQEWSAHYSLQWPTEGSRPQQVHHIVPIYAGGVNQWWNLSPMTDENHKKLHASTEERACFSRNFIEQKTCRLILKFKEIYHEIIERIPDRKYGIESPVVPQSGSAT
jgi:hypothetical protein